MSSTDDRTAGHTSADPATDPAPFDLHLEAAMGALTYSQLLRDNLCLRFPWPAVDALTGPLMPGWLTLVGARAKGGKSTFLREVFNAWVEMGHRVVYVGTEQSAAILKLLWACLRLQLPARVAFDPKDPDHERVLRDLIDGQKIVADIGIIVADPGLTLAAFVRWARYAYKIKARALILDHFHRLECEPGEQQSAAIREIKNISVKSGMVMLAAAQLKQGDGGPLGEYEVPGPHSWAGTAGLQRECDVAVQLWRPFVSGLKRGEKQAARDDPERLSAIVQHDTMAVRVSAHRYRSLEHRLARLRVDHDALASFGVGR